MIYQQYISESEFHDHWRVRLRLDGSLFTFEDVRNEQYEHVWTIVESGDDVDGNWYAAPGLHVVNKLGYVVTDKAWIDETLDAIYFLDDDERNDEVELYGEGV